MARLALFALAIPVIVLAQPQGQLLWGYPCDEGIYSTTAIQDLDGDSLSEVVAAVNYFNSSGEPRKVYCLSGATGDTIWINRTTYGVWGNRSIDVSPDLSGDGISDVLLGTAGGYTTPGRSVIAINGLTGDTLWRYTRYEQWGWVYSVRPFADIDGDTCPDVVGVAGTSSSGPGYPGAAVLVSGRTGGEIWFYRLPEDAAECVAPFEDVNGDSVPDVVIGAGGNLVNDTVYCLSGADGTPIWRHAANSSNADVRRIADVNGSGTDDIVTGGWSYEVYCLEGSNGESLWVTSLGTGNVVMEVVPIRDTDGDGIDDVVVGSWDTRVHVLSGTDGSTLWSASVGNDVWAVDTLTDVTGDGVSEVVAGCLGDGVGRVSVFDGADGTPLWYHDFAERVYDVTGVPDLNGNGHADVVVGLQDHDNEVNHLFAFDGLPPSGTAGGGPAGPAVPVRFDASRQALVMGLAPGSRYTVDLFDPAGRRIAPPFRGIQPGAVSTSLSIADICPTLPDGTCFARVTQSDGTTTTVKMIMVAAR